MTYTKEELELMIHRMRTASNEFYRLAVGVGNHAFIEFAGLMNEYISVCERAVEQSIDFTEANVHAGGELPMEPHHFEYLMEKLECIYGPTFAWNGQERTT